MIMGKNLCIYTHHFCNKTIFMQATNTYTIKTNIIPATSVLDRVIRTHLKELM